MRDAFGVDREQVSKAFNPLKGVSRLVRRQSTPKQAMAVKAKVRESIGSSRPYDSGPSTFTTSPSTFGGRAEGRWAADAAKRREASAAKAKSDAAWKQKNDYANRGNITKADASGQRRTSAVLGAIPTVGGYVSPVYGAVQAKKGRKAAVAGRTFGRNIAEGAAGSLPGTALMVAGMMKGKIGLARAGKYTAMGGALAGQSHGSYAAMRNAQNRGDIQGVKAKKG